MRLVSPGSLIPRLWILAVIAELAVAPIASNGRIRAQPPSPPRDSSRTDTVRMRGCFECGQIVVYGLLFAPGALVAAQGSQDTMTVAGGPLDIPDVFVSAYVTGGSGFSDTSSWAHSENVELFARGVYVSARFEHIYEPRDKEYLTTRIGHLWRGGRMLFGGVTAGYRATRGGAAHAGAEVAFPLVAGGRRWRTLFEVSYLFGGDGAFWNYRLQTQWALRGGPFFIGFDCDLHNLPIRRNGQVETGALGLLFGVRR